MVLPITKKPATTIRFPIRNKFGSVGYNFERFQQKYVQKMPIDRPLAYQMLERKLTVQLNPDNYWVCTLRSPDAAAVKRARDLAYSQAYQKFVGLCLQTERVELGMNIATAMMTRKLLSGILTGVTRMEYLGSLAERHDRFSRALRNAARAGTSKKEQRYWRKVAGNALGVRPTTQKEVNAAALRQGLRSGAHHFSAEYLAFHFGLAPLLGDMFTTLRLLQEGYTNKPIDVKASARRSYYSDSTFAKGPGQVRVIIGAEVVVTDEVLFVLNRMGLVNPAVVAWDSVPFSFVADWFANFQQMLAAPTDFVGVSVSKCYVAEFGDFKVVDRYNSLNPNIPSRVMTTNGHSLDRSTPSQAPVPSFHAKVPIGGWRRSLAQISLLTLFGLSRKTTSL